MAQADGVHVDPDSPAGKEYALPLDSARREATPGVGGSNPPLFGAGISPAGGSSREGGPTEQKQGRDAPGIGNASGDGNASEGDASGGRPTASGVPGAAAVGDGGGGFSAALMTALVVVAVLVTGGAIGLVLRQTRSTTPTR